MVTCYCCRKVEGTNIVKSILGNFCVCTPCLEMCKKLTKRKDIQEKVNKIKERIKNANN